MFDSRVSTTDVRTRLDLPQEADSVISDATIQQAITHAEVLVENAAVEDTSFEQKRMAVIDVAAYRAFSTSESSFKERKEALDVALQINVEERLAQFKNMRDDALDEVEDDPEEGEEPGRIYTFGDRRSSRHRYH